ncbi:MAG: hypothetical protein L6R35_004811 [Caloplaca aegaea]|nr:MAG: hypothetical protein L6R35_004811 [Caloplaca aegaea]
MALENPRPTKRLSSVAGFDDHVISKRRQGLAIHHQITHGIDGACTTNEAALDNNNVAESLLTRSISLALDVVGFDASEPLALDSFRVGVEECMRFSISSGRLHLLNLPDIHHFAASVRQSMLSCRRTQVTAQDFLQALHTHQLSLRSLIPHLRPPIPKCWTRVVLPYEPSEEEEQHSHEFLGPALYDASTRTNQLYVPHHLPPFPSKHTYRATEEFPVREEDPRKIRERATEEGRLGEEALRRLVSARVADRPSSARAGRAANSIRTKREELWKATMQAATAQYMSEHSQDADMMDLDFSRHGAGPTNPNYGRISSAVNADRKFWRKPGPIQKPKQINGNGVS